MYGDKYRWFIGTVENNLDPLKMGRVQVRIAGVHSNNEEDIRTYDLPWAQCVLPTTEGGISGIGRMPQLQPGAQVTGFFLDNESSQIPLIIGSIPKIDLPNETQNKFAGDPRVEHGFGAGQVYDNNPGNFDQYQTGQFQAATDTTGPYGDPIDYPQDCSQSWIESRIRHHCKAPRYLNPSIVIQIYRSEGLTAYQSKNTKGKGLFKYNGREASFGPFQLYIKPGTNLGAHYQNTTGGDLKKENNRKGIDRQIEFVLDYAIRMGNWNDYYGWVGHPRGSKNSGTEGFNYGGKSKRKTF